MDRDPSFKSDSTGRHIHKAFKKCFLESILHGSPPKPQTVTQFIAALQWQKNEVEKIEPWHQDNRKKDMNDVTLCTNPHQNVEPFLSHSVWEHLQRHTNNAWLKLTFSQSNPPNVRGLRGKNRKSRRHIYTSWGHAVASVASLELGFKS